MRILTKAALLLGITVAPAAANAGPWYWHHQYWHHWGYWPAPTYTYTPPVATYPAPAPATYMPAPATYAPGTYAPGTYAPGTYAPPVVTPDGTPVVTPAAPAGGFGAIAYSPSTGRFGTAWGQVTVDFAQQAAVAACNVGVADCVSEVAEQGQFAVLTRGTGGVSTAWDADLNVAQRTAIEACNAKGTSCAVVATVHD